MEFPMVYPSVVQVRNRKSMFFMGDRWHEIGPVIYGPPVINDRGAAIGIPAILPDANAYFQEHHLLDDGTDEWFEWGPRLN